MKKSSLVHPRDEILQTMERIYQYSMTTTSGGNLSIREPDGSIWITPASVDKGSLGRGDIVCVRPDGTIEGDYQPSSEIPFHQSIYAARPDIHGIVHAHPVALIAFSISKQAPDTHLFHQARHVCGEVGFASYATPGSDALAENIAGVFNLGHDCVVMENHGVVTGGADLQSAFQKFETLEFTAKTIIRAGILSNVRYLDEDQIELPRRNFVPLQEFQPEPPSSAEKDLRRTLCEFVQRGYQQRLLISTEGSFSARLDQDSFLITPYRVDRHTVDVEDIVLVRKGAREQGKIPSRASRNHQAIYDRHPEIGAIVNAYTVNATAFSVTGATLSSRTIPESYVFLRDVDRIPYGLQFSDDLALSRVVSKEKPVVILENDGVLVTGADVFNAFDRLEVLESTAEALIDSRSLGEVQPLSDEIIEALHKKYLS